jgi:hypothetical protein
VHARLGQRAAAAAAGGGGSGVVQLIACADDDLIDALGLILLQCCSTGNYPCVLLVPGLLQLRTASYQQLLQRTCSITSVLLLFSLCALAGRGEMVEGFPICSCSASVAITFVVCHVNALVFRALVRSS